MTWIDTTLIVIFIFFLAAGAKLGSLWSALCLAAGFVGAYVADLYAPAVAGTLGSFKGVDLLAGALLFGATLVVILAPGYFLSKVAGVFIGFLNPLFGLLTGGAAGLLAICLGLAVLVPRLPASESNQAWKKSKLAAPLYRFLEDTFNDPKFRPASALDALKSGAEDFLEPVAATAGKAAKKAVRQAAESVQRKLAD